MGLLAETLCTPGQSYGTHVRAQSKLQMPDLPKKGESNNTHQQDFNLSSCDCLAKLIEPKPRRRKGSSESEVLVVKTIETFFIPQVAAIVE